MQVSAGGVALEVEVHGSPRGEPLLMIMGLGMQLVAWHEDFVDELARQGFFVIRFDNRDIGLSQGFDHLGTPALATEALKFTFGLPVTSGYTLRDMAGDAAALLDALGIASAHVCGASMGGMIAQHMAVHHAARVRSLTLMMTSSGARRLPGPTLKVRAAMLSRPKNPRDIDNVVAHYVKLYQLIGSPAYPAGEDYLTQRLAMTVRRSYRPQGTARQLMAIAADGDRTEMLRRIRVPTQLIHGRQDPLVPVAAAHDLLAGIDAVGLDIIDGMGHDLPVPLWPRFAAGICRAAGRA
ncbi:MAG: alpha/beta fold hydrolase [Rhizobacter sp.]|nr:alpha/beta fold hydrolase [Rhizobacter sp.]